MNDALAMNQTKLDFGPRPKRLKTEKARAGDNIAARFTNGYDIAGPSHASGLVNGNGRPNSLRNSGGPRLEGSVMRDMGMASGQASQNSPSGQTLSHARSSNLRARPALHELDVQSHSGPSTFKVDFLNAPRQPIDMVWWIAQQITHYQPTSGQANGVSMSQQSLHPPGSSPGQHSQAVTYHEVDAAAEKERLRIENRVRKQRWRQDNQERNKDNDLRCRVNKLAKAKYGPEDSTDKLAFIENEFNIRRHKREQKQRNRATHFGTLPTFSSASDLQTNLRALLQRGHKPGVEAAGRSLINILLGIENQKLSDTVIEGAKQLINQLNDGSASPEALTEAMELFSGSEELRKVLEAGLYDGKEEEEHESTSGEEGRPTAMHAARNDAANVEPLTAVTKTDTHSTTKTITALNALLNDMTDTRKYDSPYGRPAPEAPSSLNPSSLNGSKGKASLKSKNAPETSGQPKSSTNGGLLDISGIDAILALANGGSLTEDEDDKTIEDPNEFPDREVDFTAAGEDDDVAKALQHVVGSLAAERRKKKATNNMGNLGVPSEKDLFGTNTAKNQVVEARNLYMQAGVSVNSIVPNAQAYATSQLYANISNRLSSSPLGGQTHERSIASLPTINQLKRKSTSGQHSGTITFDTAPSSKRTREEQKKVKIYGYPPAPGSKVKALVS